MNIAIILYQPQDVVNVAAIIRVMSNFGLHDLRLIEPAAFDPYRIEGIAHHTQPIIQAVRRYESLAAATADCALIVGTTGRPRAANRQVLTPRQAAPILRETAGLQPDRKAAVLFGREQDGLPNEALDLCHAVLTIPTSAENRSLNLAQAALVVAYELFMAGEMAEPEGVPTAAPGALAELPADAAAGPEREAMFAALEELLRTLYPGTTEVRLGGALSRLRTMLMRAVPRTEETAALTNLCRHAVRRLHQNPAEASNPR
ncbi:MAG: tRNA/rRNA methyltransferase [Symbiobacteriaceae bacterium]|nr:tRNA/rRNA methyltransferase [Symbiobacteriaceae bacterium]